jgi:hypothetical protein
MKDLFDEPGPVEVKTVSGPRFLDKHLLHRTSRGEFVRSKSELAIAEKLNGMGISYVYEQPLQLDGKTRWPDFTIVDEDSGITYFWEHLGMLSDPQYAARWQTKRAASWPQALGRSMSKPAAMSSSRQRKSWVWAWIWSRSIDLPA